MGRLRPQIRRQVRPKEAVRSAQRRSRFASLCGTDSGTSRSAPIPVRRCASADEGENSPIFVQVWSALTHHATDDWPYPTRLVIDLLAHSWQFLDCVRQLMDQFVSAFEFNEVASHLKPPRPPHAHTCASPREEAMSGARRACVHAGAQAFLLELIDHTTSARFGTFLYNSEKER